MYLLILGEITHSGYLPGPVTFSLSTCYKSWFKHLERKTISEGGFSTTTQVKPPAEVKLVTLVSRSFSTFESQIISTGTWEAVVHKCAELGSGLRQPDSERCSCHSLCVFGTLYVNWWRPRSFLFKIRNCGGIITGVQLHVKLHIPNSNSIPSILPIIIVSNNIIGLLNKI